MDGDTGTITVATAEMAAVQGIQAVGQELLGSKLGQSVEQTIASGVERLSKLEGPIMSALGAAGTLASKIDGQPPPETAMPGQQGGPTAAGTVRLMHATLSRYEAMFGGLLAALNRSLKAHG